MGSKSTYWYHLTTEWTGTSVEVSPRSVRSDDSGEPRDHEPCICVCPSIAQCIIALGTWGDYSVVRAYRTLGRPRKATWVFDYTVTQEHRFYVPRPFEFVQALDLTPLQIDLRVLAGTLSGLKKVLDKGSKAA